MGSSADITISLLNRIRKSERLALNTLFSQYYQKLCAFAVTYVRTTEEAEEIVSDVFVNIWRNRDTINVRENGKAYLYTCVKNACLAFIRKQYPAFENLEEVLFDTNLLDLQTPQQSLELTELEHFLYQEIDNLPARCKQVFLMSRMDQLSYREIGQVLGIVEKTVENQLVKALSTLRAAVLRYEADSKPTRHLTEA